MAYRCVRDNMSDTYSTFSPPIMHHSYQVQPPPVMHSPPQTSPHLPPPHLTSPHLPRPQVTAPHLTQSQVSPYHLPPSQVTASHFSHPQETSLHLVPQSQETLFDFFQSEVIPSQIPPLPQDLLFGNNPSTDFNHSGWDGPGLPYIFHGDGLPLQNQTSVLLDENAQLPYNTHPHFEQCNVPAHTQNTWGPLEPTQPKLRCSPLGFISEKVALGGWSSMEDPPDVQFFNEAPQPFYSPTTPGLSPQYPSTSDLHSTGPHRAAGPVLHCQQSFNYSLMGSHQQLLQQTSSLPIQPELNHQLPGFSQQGQEVRLNQREECREGAEPNLGWMKLMKPETKPEVPDTRLQCMVCKRDFKSLPALNGHMRSHSGIRETSWLKKDPSTSNNYAVSMVMPVSVPVQTRGASKAWKHGEKRCQTHSGNVLYCSLMQLNEEEEEEGTLGNKSMNGGHYIPPLMLPPLRTGSGLFHTLTTRGQKQAPTVKLHNGFGDLGVETACPPPGTLSTRVMKPRINVGSDFQADIPLLQPKKRACFDTDKALLQWRPWAELEQPVTQLRVEALLRMVKSSVVAGGRVSPEYTLHVLSKYKGDFLLTTEKLLSTQNVFNKEHTGVRWSPVETRMLVKSLQLHQKDFNMVQKAVKTKSLSECVEFYYLFKKKMNLRTNTSTSLTFTLPDANGQGSSGSQDGKLMTEQHTTSQQTQKTSII